MLKYFDLKLYRKFLILAVLAGGLFAVSMSGRTSAAAPCCQDCEEAYTICYEDCEETALPPRFQQCLQLYCNTPYFNCLSHCVMC